VANAAQEQTLTITHVLWAMFRAVAAESGAASASSSVGGARSDSRRQAGVLHPAGHPFGRAGQHRRPDARDWRREARSSRHRVFWHAHFNESGAQRT